MTGARRLDAGAALDTADLAAAYAYPSRGRWLRANMVGTADGAAAASSGVTAAISGATDRELLALLRALADVVLVGPGTVRAERYGPARVRPAHRQARGDRPPPPIAVLTASLDLDLSWPLFTEPETPTILLTSADADPGRLEAASRVADVAVLPARDRAEGTDGFGVDLAAAVQALADRGHRRMLCEGGPGLLAAMAAAGLLDEICLTVSPVLAGGRSGRILRGAQLGDGIGLRLAHTLADDEGFLFLRYLVNR